MTTLTDNRKKLLEASIKNLRTSMNDIGLDSFLANTIDTLMQVERDEYLEKAKNNDKGNGFYSRAFKSLSKNCLAINVPRSRSGNFTPDTLELVKIGQDRVDEICLSLYKKGMTSRDISSLIKDMFGNKVSASKVSNLAKVFNEFRIAWNNSKLEKRYKVMFCDCIFITVKREDSYSREAVYVAYGVREDNKRELLTLNINPTESANIWGEMFDELKNRRGVENIDLIVADGLTGMENEVHKVFSKAKFQKCVVHKMRNVLNKTRPKDKAELAEDLKEIFDNFDNSSTIEKAKEKTNKFIKKWNKKYPKISRYFRESEMDYYFTYIKFSTKVRRMIYTTNSIENINRVIRKATKNKLSFQTPDNLLDYVFMVVKEFEEKNLMNYPIYNYTYFDKKENLSTESDTI